MLKLRQISEEDCKLIWTWANDPEVRAVSFSSEAIPYEDHVTWFESKLNDPSCYFYIAEDTNHEPVGQVRYDREGTEATISISLDKKFRGKGYGPSLLRLASQRFFEVCDAEVIHAYIKEGNEASIGAFKKAGFNPIGTSRKNNHQPHHLVLRKEELT
jgi:RimJ/RimL family protein N-acetyltransferase